MNFRKLLLEISNSLVSSELEKLKFLCTEYIPEGEAETIEYGFKLFAALERRGKLSEKNRAFLASLLGDIQRTDLKNKLLEIEGDQNMQLDGQSTTCTKSTCTSAATAGQYINDSEVIDCHSDIVPDDGIIKMKDSENENSSSGIDKAADGQYINDSEVIAYGIIKIKDSENENPSSAAEKAAAAAGQYVNDSEVIDCHRDVVPDDGIIKIKDSENGNSSSAIDKGDQNVQSGQGATGTAMSREEASMGLYNGIVPNELVHDLVEDLSTSWQMLGRRLGLPEGVLKNIDSEHRRVIEKGVRMFEEWKNRKTNDATMQALREGLVKIGRRDLSEKVRHFALSQQEKLLRAAVEHAVETAEERRPFPSFQDLGSALPNYPPLTTGMQRQPEEQTESMQRLSASPSVRDPSFSVPPPTSGHWDRSVWDPALSAYQPVSERLKDARDRWMSLPPVPSGPWGQPAASAGVRDPAPLPQPAPIAAPSSAHQRPPAAPTLADPSLPYPIPISQSTRDDPSLPRPAPAAPGVSGPSPLHQNSSLTDAAEVNSQQVHGPVNARGFTGQDIIDHDLNDRIRTSVPVESAPTLQLTIEGSYLDPEKYEPVKLLGSGGFAKVYLCISKETGRRMAVKMCNLGVNHHETQKQTDAVSKEVNVLRAVKHDYIVEFLYVEKNHNTLLLFLEYMEGGSVEDLLRLKGAMQEPSVRKFTRQILTAVHFLHNRGIIHKDIKGGNVLLDERQMNIKLADFGISTVMDKLKTVTGGLMTNNTVASFHWTSPELLAKKPFGRNTDIWSVGCTVVEMLTTKPPLFDEDLDFCQRMFKIVSLEVQPPRDCSSLAYGFLAKCLCESDVRSSAAQLLEEDPFVNFTEEERNQFAWIFN